MDDFAGTPGTKTGFLLRVLQFLFAAASFTFMATAPALFPHISAFDVLMASMFIQAMWSFSLAIFDAFSLVTKTPLQGRNLICFLAFGDMFTAMVSLGGASSTGGIVIWMSWDSEFCNLGRINCQNYYAPVAFAFFTWILVAPSSLIMLWILPAQ